MYEVVGDEASKADRLIGMFDTPKLAAAAVEAYNAWERDHPPAEPADPWRPMGW